MSETNRQVGMLAAEGQVHKRMRRVATPAFSLQNMRAFVPITFKKALELKDKWCSIIDEQTEAQKKEQGDTDKYNTARLDVCHWISRATFDVIGLAGEYSSGSFIPPLNI